MEFIWKTYETYHWTQKQPYKLRENKGDSRKDIKDHGFAFVQNIDNDVWHDDHKDESGTICLSNGVEGAEEYNSQCWPYTRQDK